MTTNKPKVVAYARTGALASILPRPWRLPVVSDWSPMYSDALIRLSDYEALQAECERLRKDVASLVEALELAQGFLRNKGYSEEDPLLLGAINAALAAYRQGGDL